MYHDLDTMLDTLLGLLVYKVLKHSGSLFEWVWPAININKDIKYFCMWFLEIGVLGVELVFDSKLAKLVWVENGVDHIVSYRPVVVRKALNRVWNDAIMSSLF